MELLPTDFEIKKRRFREAVEIYSGVVSSERKVDPKADLFGFLASAYSHLGMTEEATKYSSFTRGTNSVQ
jgi:hypothetical protein